MEEKMIVENEEQERQPDAAFTQEVEDRPYHVRVFFPEGCAATLQEKIELTQTPKQLSAFSSFPRLYHVL